MNRVQQHGNLARDTELTFTKDGTAVLNCCIATSRRIPKGDDWIEEVTFVDFTMWGKRAEAFAKFHRKGSEALIEGRLSVDTWQDRETGSNRSRMKMTVESWEFCGGKAKGESYGDALRNNAAPDASDEDTPF